MPLSVELVCVDPKQVQEFWPHVRSMLFGAVLRTKLSHTRDVEAQVLDGSALLWLAWNGRNIEAACVTALRRTDDGTVCIMLACAGRKRDRWLHLLERIEQYAKAEACISLRIFGRVGWERVLPGYRKTAIVLEKELT